MMEYDWLVAVVIFISFEKTTEASVRNHLLYYVYAA